MGVARSASILHACAMPDRASPTESKQQGGMGSWGRVLLLEALISALVFRVADAVACVWQATFNSLAFVNTAWPCNNPGK